MPIPDVLPKFEQRWGATLDADSAKLKYLWIGYGETDIARTNAEAAKQMAALSGADAAAPVSPVVLSVERQPCLLDHRSQHEARVDACDTGELGQHFAVKSLEVGGAARHDAQQVVGLARGQVTLGDLGYAAHRLFEGAQIPIGLTFERDAHDEAHGHADLQWIEHCGVAFDDA